MSAFLHALIIAANLSDTGSTIVATNRPGVHEDYPLYPNRPALFLVKGGQTTAEVIGERKLWRTGHHAGAIWWTVAVVGINGWVTYHNLQQGRH